MRSPRRRDVEGKCRAALPALCEKHGLSFVDDVAVDREGWVNLCFFVGDELVVRFNARDPHLPKFRREQIAYELLGARGVPVPRVLAIDEDRDIVGFDVLVTQRLPGTNLEADWNGLSLEERHQLMEEAAQWLARVHEVEFTGFGETAEGTPHATWSDAVRFQIGAHLAEAQRIGTFRAHDIDRCSALFSERVTPLLDRVTTACLVHGDYHTGNMLHVGDLITGLVDFEWSFAGDALFDLSYQQNLGGISLTETFLEAFGPLLDEEQLYRQELYRCMRNVEISNVARQHFPPAEADEYREVTLTHLAWLETVCDG